MTDALIGFSGFVGSTLLAQARFDARYRSTNIGEIEGRTFDSVVCAGAPAQKWIANRDPETDWRNIEALIAHLQRLRCRRFVLISTVDVFRNPRAWTKTALSTSRACSPTACTAAASSSSSNGISPGT
ncbi:hypothetical protein ACFSHR_04885 [Azotobacter chroococcum]